MKTKAELLEVLNAGAIAKHAYGFVAPEDTLLLFWIINALNFLLSFI